MHHASQGMHYVSLVPSIKFLVFVVSQLRNDEIVQNPKWKGRGFKGTRLCLKVLYNFNSVSLFIFCWHARWLFRYLNECSIFSWLDCITILFLFLVPWVWRCHVSSSRGSWRQSNISLCSRGREHLIQRQPRKENQLRWSSLSLCGKGLSVGRSRVNGRGAAVNAAAGCGAMRRRRRQCSRSPLYQPWHSFLSVPTHSYILCSTAGNLALVSFRCSFSSTFSRPC